MTEYYVVISQRTLMLGNKGGIPVAIYPDYPSAYAYAKTIFKAMLGSPETAKDLIFMLPLTPTPTAPTTTPTTPAAA